MNEERIERGVRAALERDARPLPPVLRARLSAIPDEFPRERRSPRLTQFVAAAGAVAAVLVLAAAALVLVGLHDSTVAPATTATPSPGATAPAVVGPASPGSLAAPAWAVVSSAALDGVSLGDVVPFRGGYLALGWTSSPVAPQILTSENGTDWTRHDPVVTPAGPNGILGVVPGSSGLIGVGGTGYPCSTGRASVFSSSDGIHWSASDLPSPSPLPGSGQSYGATAIAAGPAGYVVLGAYGGCTAGPGAGDSWIPLNTPLLWRSSDGQHWTFVRFPEANVNLDALAAGGPGFLLGGDRHVGSRLDAAIWTSRDGATWVAANPLPDNRGMGDSGPMVVNTITAGPDRILAVSGRMGYEPQGRIWSSRDGITWQKVADLTDADPRVPLVCWTPAGFVAAALGGDTPGADQLTIRSSRDGASWTTVLTVPPGNSVPSAIASSGDSVMIVGTSGQGGLVVVGRVAAAVAPVAPPSPSAPTAPLAGPASLGGFLWQRIDSQFGGAAPGPMTRAGSALVMATDPFGSHAPGGPMPHPTLWRSADGSSWQRLPNSPAFGGVQDRWVDWVQGMTASGSGLIAVGMQQYADGSMANAEAWTSPDGGQTWTRASVAEATQTTMDFVYPVADGFVAIGTDGYSFHAGMEGGTAIWTSPDGRRWTRLPQSEVPTRVAIRAVAHGASGYVAAGQNLPPGAPPAGPVPIWTSPDGIHFTAVPRNPGTPAAGDGVRQVVWTGSAFVAVGDPLSLTAPSAWWSANGLDWQQVELPTGAPAGAQVRVEALAQTPIGLVAVGALDDTLSGTTNRGIIWESSDGRSWQEITTSAAFDNVDLQPIQVFEGSHVFAEGRDDSAGTTMLWMLADASAGS